VTGGTAPQSTASVVIAAHVIERSAGLTQAVASAFSQQPGPREVIVAVDNNLDLYKWVCREIPDVIPVHNQGTRGASATRNAGASVASGSVLAFLDDDTVAEPGWLRCLTAPLARPEVAGVGGYAEPMWFGRTPDWMPEEFLWVVGASYRGLPKTAATVRNVWSENMAVARDDFWAVGGFREGFSKVGQFVFRSEDTDFCIRLSTALAGRTWWYEPSARIRHSVPPQRATLRYFLLRCYLEGKGKAEMAAMLGLDEGLRDERRHASRTLPRGFCRELRQAILSLEFGAAQRASAICAGLTATGLGYLVRRTRPAAERTLPAQS
jgi:glycosyltransferase involved in cell wall biosynthesis